MASVIGIRGALLAVVIARLAAEAGADRIELENRVIEPPAPVDPPLTLRIPQAGRKPAALTPRAQRKGFRP